MVEVLLARDFETDCFKRLFHKEAFSGQLPAFSFCLAVSLWLLALILAPRLRFDAFEFATLFVKRSTLKMNEADCRMPRALSSRRAFLLRGLRVLRVGAWRACAKASYVARRAVARSRARANHLCEQLYVIVGLARHLLADRVQLFEESRFAIHDSRSDELR